jgi:hypothetical protein
MKPWRDEALLERTREESQLHAVEERNPGIVAAEGAIIAIIKYSFLPILKENAGITDASRQLGRPGLGHNPAPPGSELLMEDFVPHVKIGMLFGHQGGYRNRLFFFVG